MEGMLDTEKHKLARRAGYLSSSQTLMLDNTLLFLQIQCKLLEEKDHGFYEKWFILRFPMVLEMAV